MEVFNIEVKRDFLERLTRAHPVAAIAEMVWNSLDADATRIDVKSFDGEIGLDRIEIIDNGTGIEPDHALDVFKQLGGSWKQIGGVTPNGHRPLHGSEGKGRLRALALGRVCEWFTVYEKSGRRFEYTITIVADRISEVRLIAAEPSKSPHTGTRIVISELLKNWDFLNCDETVQQLSEIFALYLRAYPDVQITIPTGSLDPKRAIAGEKTFQGGEIRDELGRPHSVSVDIIEWRRPTERAIYLCNEGGLALGQTHRKLQVPGFDFSAYLKSSYVAELAKTGRLELADMDSKLTASVDEAVGFVREFYRERRADTAKNVVETWKAEKVYPFKGEPATPIERIERQVFDLVAIGVNEHLPEFGSAPIAQKKLQLRMLRQAIEKSPEDLQVILNEVLNLPLAMQKEFAALLHEASLSAIISASKLVTDRLKFLTGLETILYEQPYKDALKERSQLHRLLAENSWIFGEEFHLTIDDESLSQVLRKHQELLGDAVVVDEPVKPMKGKRAIVDLVLSRAKPRQRVNELDHLVVELKRPNVTIGAKEITQIKQYALAIARDERFRSLSTRWTFWIISNDLDESAQAEAAQTNRPRGVVYQSDTPARMTIWAKPWSEVLEENRMRLNVFQQRLEHRADQGTALAYLRETYDRVLAGLPVTEPVTDSSG